MLTIRRATPADLPHIWVLVQEAVARMNANGNPQWGADYPTPAHFSDGIDAGELYAACGADGSVLGVALLNTWQEDCYEDLTGWERPFPALCIHKVAVAPRAQRTGVASALFAHAYALAKEMGLSSLRMDTYSLNVPMQTLVAREGFRYIGDVSFGRPLPYHVYEKVL